MTSPSDQPPHERIVGLYEDNAAAWDAVRGSDPRLELAWLERFAALLRPGAAVLDVGCGSGRPVAMELVRRGFRVTGIDSAQSSIEIARAYMPEQEWIVGDMRAHDLGRRFDGVIAWHSSFHLTPEDQRALLPRLAAHTAPGGALMFTSGEEAGVRIGEWQGEPLYHASLAPAEYESLLAASGLEVVDHRARDPDCGGATVWLARKR